MKKSVKHESKSNAIGSHAHKSKSFHKIKHPVKKPFPGFLNNWKNLTVILVIILLLVVFTKGFKDIPFVGSSNSVSEEVVKLDFYVMSQCPYGTQVEDAIAPVLEQLGDNIDFNLHFIANDNGDGTFSSLHGQPEVDGNIAQLCAAKYNPDKYMDMITCQNANARAIPGNWEQCAKDEGLSVNKIKSCFEGDEGKSLLSASIKKTNIVSATGSPTIYLNDEQYSGGRSESDFFRTICNAFDVKPSACSDIPEPVEVSLIILNDQRCKECQVSGLISSLSGIFPGLDYKIIDYSSSEGKSIYEDLGLSVLPVLLFDSSINDGEGYNQVKNYLRPVGDFQTLNIGASFDPTSEICDNGVDDDFNGLVDCQESSCSGELTCRNEIAGKLDLFVMSQCPYGVKAETALKEVLDNFPGLTFNLHFIANDNGDGTFSSLHGQPEVDGNIRQACIESIYPNQFLDYVYCQIDNYRDLENNWESCASQNGISASDISSCVDSGVGADLLRGKIALTNELGIGASPTWLANNRYKFSGIDAETVKQNFCIYNPDFVGCENTLSSSSGNVPSGAGCGV